MAGPSTLVIPSGKIFFVKRLELNGPCKAQSVGIQFAGKIVPPTMDTWVGDRGSWIVISDVNNLTIDAKGGIIDGNGSSWWEKCRSCRRPTSLRFHNCNGLVVNSLSMTNSPGAHISVNGCNGAKFSGVSITAPEHSPNTDGFDIAVSKYITIKDSTIATGDDCIAINGGCSNINATRLFCGPGHGISIGSLGKNGSHEIVEEIYVNNCSFIGTTNGARIKTWPGGSGYARKITFDQIILKNAQNPIIIDQNYGVKQPSASEQAVMVSEVTYRGFVGTSARDLAIVLKCSTLGCFNITFDNVHIVSSQPGKPAYASYNNTHGTVINTVPKISLLK
uniref:Polygalacturonase At3g15720 family n=2 Tax=Cajanus cajan TaxID=3821 RepID=A0A151QRP3_CAJCA|nr:putative polygalacturonase At3g15720 family [Cajanus cajan]